MSDFIESLESRMLLHGSGSGGTVGELVADAKLLVADVKVLSTTGSANYKLIVADLKAAGEAKSSAALLKALSVEGKSGFKDVSNSVKHTISLLTKDVKKIEGFAKQLSKKPSNVELAAKVTAADTTLQTDAAGKLTTITGALTAQHDTNSANLKAITDANPTNTQLATDVSSTIVPRTTAARTAVTNDATTALTTGVNDVVAAFPG